jgi:hypothetical protein
MPAGRRPKNLHDVSHLFLSRSTGPEERVSNSSGAYVWLISQTGLVNRAHFAAGCSYAISTKGIAVSLLEFDSGLPNVCYYSATDTREYLGPVLAETKILKGRIDPDIEYTCFRNPESLHSHDESDVGSPHVFIVAFELSETTSRSEHIDSILQHCSKIASSDRGPDATIIVSDAAALRSFLEVMALEPPDDLVFHVLCGDSSHEHSGIAETIPMPTDIRSTWSTRALPKDSFFDGLGSNLLQLISHRRKALER